jgi:ATP-dependent Clp protease ATP-binding subunit ClpC
MSSLKKNAKNSRFYSVIILERVFPHRLRHRIYGFTSNSAILFAAVTFLLFVLGDKIASILSEYSINIETLQSKILGITLLTFSLWAIVFLLESFFRSYYFKRTDGGKDLFSFDTLVIFDKSEKGDLAKAFLRSRVGEEIMFRCGIGAQEVKTFLKKRSTVSINGDDILPQGKVFGISDLVAFILEHDKEFSNFVFAHGVRVKECIGAAGWVARGEEKGKYVEKWWSKERLGRVQPLGEDWAYGQTYTLNKYSSDILVSGRFFSDGAKHEKELLQMEAILGRSQEANAIIVGEDSSGKLDLIYDFAQRISGETAQEVLKHKRVVVLNLDVLIAATGDKIVFEREVLRLFGEVSNAGNIILVLEDISSFILSAKTLGSDILNLIDPYLSSSSIQVIATSGLEGFHQNIENNPVAVKRFEKVMMEEPDENTMSAILEDTAVGLERRYGIVFTYPAILSAITSAQNYFPEVTISEKAIDFLVEVAPLVQRKKGRVVEKEDILSLVGSKTNIPVGEITEVEKQKLMHLEEILHERIVGQEKAVSLISNAMRRARAGVRDMKKPIGSFLFVGPTGVGKTETAKALAEVFFGDEYAVARLDMSEYQTEDALTRLIGSFEEGKMGALSKILKEKPYGVLLLDEFEKTNPDIHDLFLQILDEGFFSDMKGKRVNARNIIFIATSNAGSDIIWEAIKEGKKLSEMKDTLVEEIIKRGRFKPELLNRFDGIVLFHPLEFEDLKKIAVIILTNLQKRLKERGVSLVINDVLINYVAKKGSDPMFGARPMKRVIKEDIEQKVADGLINGELRDGSNVEFNQDDLK